MSVNPAGPAYERATDRYIARQAGSGNLDGYETRILGNQHRRIRARVGWDKAHGLDPRQDPRLAGLQRRHRKTAKMFANWNP